jgi:hypothetical protein
MAYNPALHTTSNKPYSIGQAGPTDARTYFYDESLFVYRPYQSTAEVLAYLDQPRYRSGHFSVVINTGGTLDPDGTLTGGTNNFWTFLNGTADGDLVERITVAPPTVTDTNFAITDLTATGNRSHDFAGYDFSIAGAKSVSLDTFLAGGTSAGDIYFGFYATQDMAEIFADKGYIPDSTAKSLQIYPDKIIIHSTGASYPSGDHNLPISVNGTYADSAGNITINIQPVVISSIGLDLDGRGTILTTGQKGYVRVPFAGTITDWSIISDVSGSCMFDVWKAAAYPTVANSITGSAKPTLSNSTTAASSTLTGWTTAVTAGDIFGWNLDSVATITKAILQLTLRRT